MGIGDRRIQDRAGEFAKQVDFLVGGLGHGFPKVFQVLAGPGIGVRETAIKHLDDLIGHGGQTMDEERHQEGIAAHGGAPLEGLGTRFAGELS